MLKVFLLRGGGRASLKSNTFNKGVCFPDPLSHSLTKAVSVRKLNLSLGGYKHEENEP